MMVERKIDREAIDTAVDGIMTLMCDSCHHCYEEPTITGECAACECCPIEGKVREALALMESEVVRVFGYALADSIKEVLSIP